VRIVACALAVALGGCGVNVREIEARRPANDASLVAALERGDARAAVAMGRIQSPEYLPALLRATREGHGARLEAMWAAGQLALGYDWRGCSEARRAAVEERLGDADAAMRAAACVAWGKLGGDPARLVPALRDADARVRVAATRGIFWAKYLHGTASAEARDALHAAAGDADADVRWGAVYALQALARKESLATFEKSLADANVWVRMFAVRGLSKLKAPRPESAARDTELVVRTEVARGWDARKPATRPLDELLRAVEKRDLSAVEALGSVADDAARVALERLVSHGDVGVEWCAIEALAARGDARSVPSLAARAKGPATIVLEPLVGALEKLKATDALAEIARGGSYPYAAMARRALRRPPEETPAVDRRVHASPLSGTWRLELTHAKGKVAMVLDADAAPEHVTTVVTLARRGYYDGLDWHRVVPNFVIQGGDPRRDGYGDPGYRIMDEISPQFTHERGAVGMSKMAKDTGDGQLYITHVPTPHLDGRYTIFGKVVEGMEVVDRIEPGDRILKAEVK
jgi:cyclophilin family peptidyl-prolyl cis-trans isomerase